MSEEKEKPNYYGIMPASVRYDKSLHPNAKILYTEISALSNKEGYCFASNNYFANLFEVSDRSIRNWIKNLKDKGFIKVQLIYKNGTKEIQQRKLYIADPLIAFNLQNSGSIGEEKNFHTPMEKEVDLGEEKNFHTPTEENFPTPVEKNFLDNTTSFNTTSINISLSKKEFISLLEKEKKEILNEIWKKYKFRSDVENYFLFRAKDDWKGFSNLIADCKWWESGYKKKFPEKYKTTREVKKHPTREKIKRTMALYENDYYMYFADAEIKDDTIIVDNNDALKHQELLNRINLKIETKDQK